MTDEHFAYIRGAFEQLDKRMSGVEAAIPALRGDLEKRFDIVERRFDIVERRFDAVDRKFEAVARKFDSVDGKFDHIGGRFDLWLRWVLGTIFGAWVSIVALIITKVH